MVARLSAVSRASRRLWVGALPMLTALACTTLTALWFPRSTSLRRLGSACARRNEEADLGFVLPTAMRAGGTSLSRLPVRPRAVVIRRAGEKQIADFKVGDSVAGEVMWVKPNVVVVKVPGFPRNAVALPSLLEKYPATEYEVGEEFVGKVYRADASRGLVLTQLDEPDYSRLAKPERMEAKFDLGEVSKMVNEEIEGSVRSTAKFGIFIDIGLRGEKDALAPSSMLPNGKTPWDFKPGQKVQCWVWGSKEAGKKITVSLVAPPEGGFPQPS